MRVIVFSDSHGLLGFATLALQNAGKVDSILHAGDHYSDGLALASETGLPVKAVAGNCDRPGKGSLEELLDLMGHKVLLLHGHRVGGIGSWEDRLLARAAVCGASAVIYGHTHAASVAVKDGVLIFNPGSIATPRDGDQPSYGILEISKKTIVPYIFRV